MGRWRCLRQKSPLAPLVKGGTKAVLAEGETAAKPPFDKGGWGDSTNGVETRDIKRIDIFHYTYAVLHDPAYREKYQLNLKREFPHIPFYADFSQWAAWGAALMALHLNYETAEPYPLERADADGVTNPKAKLKADKASGQIILDSQTVLSGVPLEGVGVQAGQPLSYRVGARPLQGEKAQRPDHPRSFQHLQVCGLQRRGRYAVAAGVYGERGNGENRPYDECRTEQRRTGGET